MCACGERSLGLQVFQTVRLPEPIHWVAVKELKLNYYIIPLQWRNKWKNIENEMETGGIGI